VDQESHAVLTVHASLLILRDKLEDLATAEDGARFVKEADVLRKGFLEDVERAYRALRVPHPNVERDPTMLSTLETIQSALPAQIDALADLATAGDWAAVSLRLQNQMAPLSSLTSSLVEKVDLEVSGERAQAQESIQRLQHQVFLMLPLIALFTLLIAGILGTIVTRSITQPLAQLDTAARALAQGEFQFRIAVEGEDELATLERVFNDTTHHLSNLYGALTTSEERFRTVVAAAPVGIAVLDDKATVQMCNPRFLEIVGLTAEQAAGMRLDDPGLAVLREDGKPCPATERPSQRALATGKPALNVVLRTLRPASSESRWVLTSAWPLLRNDGRVYQVITTLTDITHQKRVEEELRSSREALRRSQEDFRIIFDHAAIGMVLVDPSGHLLRGNPAFRSMLGYTERELPALTFAEVTHADDVTLNQSLYQDVIAGKLDQYQLKKRYIRKDGDLRSARVTVSALRAASGELQYSVAMVEDITSQEMAERTLLQMSNRLLHIQEEEQRRIAREVHDSTSQEMTALTLNLGALKVSEHTFPAKARKQIAESLALAKRVAREIRTFSYLLHPPMLNELGLWAALRMFVEEFRERSGLQVSLEISKEVEATKLHPSQEIALFRCVQEALANIHRHSGSRTASVQFQLKNRSIEASITDTGRGLPVALLKEIQTSKGLAGGVGISGMRERIAYIGGHLEIRTDEFGTTITAVIPVDYPNASAESLGEQSFLGAPSSSLLAPHLNKK
jgi:PAS domain S-box-containing protein